MDEERNRLLAMARKEYEKDTAITECDIEELVGEMLNQCQIPKDGDRQHFHKTAYTFDNINIYNHYKKKYKEFREHCLIIMEGRTEITERLYRGTKLNRDFKIGRSKFTGVASWSRDVEIAQDFGDHIYILDGPKCVTSLKEYSLYPMEKEVLVTSNIRVEVKEIQEIEEKIFGRTKKRRFVTFEVIEDVRLRNSDTDSGISESEISDVEKRASFLPDSGPVSSDDFEFHKHLLKSRKN